GLSVKCLNTSNKYSTIEVSFGSKFFHNLFIWNKEISNKNDYLELCNIASKFTKGEWLLVGNSLTNDKGEDLWEQLQMQTKKFPNDNMLYSSEYDILDSLKEKFSRFYADNKKIDANKKELFVYFLKGRMGGFRIEMFEERIFEENYKLFNRYINNFETESKLSKIKQK
ncbi:1787_t:CDS:2, partial [Gigaspora margarita]